VHPAARDVGDVTQRCKDETGSDSKQAALWYFPQRALLLVAACWMLVLSADFWMLVLLGTR
jgi:hypothetical protein